MAFNLLSISEDGEAFDCFGTRFYTMPNGTRAESTCLYSESDVSYVAIPFDLDINLIQLFGEHVRNLDYWAQRRPVVVTVTMAGALFFEGLLTSDYLEKIERHNVTWAEISNFRYEGRTYRLVIKYRAPQHVGAQFED